MKTIRIILLILIIVGIGLIATQKLWVPKLVDYIVTSDTPIQIQYAQVAKDDHISKADAPIQIQYTQAKDDFKTKSISSAYVYGPKIKVYLYAPDEKKSTITDSYCGGTAGSEERSGNYNLILDNGTILNIGPMDFIAGTSWDGKMIIDQFDPHAYMNFIIVYQYGDCNNTIMRVYTYNASQGKLTQDTFTSLDGSPKDWTYVVGQFKKLLDGNWCIHPSIRTLLFLIVPLVPI